MNDNAETCEQALPQPRERALPQAHERALARVRGRALPPAQEQTLSQGRKQALIAVIDTIFDRLRKTADSHAPLSARELEVILRAQMHQEALKAQQAQMETPAPVRKRDLLPFYQQQKQQRSALQQGWLCGDGLEGPRDKGQNNTGLAAELDAEATAELEARFIRSVRMKPRRTASGVATITVITRPHTCSSNCIYCPCDLRMPKSYIANEPACQRAEQAFFDPYIQVASRLRALHQMGHAVDKIELIVLGGTWSDYPVSYQLWFIRELFRALNEWPACADNVDTRMDWYRSFGLTNQDAELQRFVHDAQEQVNEGHISYNQAFKKLYAHNKPHQDAWSHMSCSADDLLDEQHKNESAACRVVGLVIETRPDTITPRNLTLFRRLGCTKIQIGIQSTYQHILDANKRNTSCAQIKRAFSLIRLFGFKIHSHLMLNLVDATPESDRADFVQFVHDPGYLPDEIKLYPCALVAGTQLCELFEDRRWRPYSANVLVDILVQDVLAAPPFVRISRMIRDISSSDILVGNKRTNLRQIVESRLRATEKGDMVGQSAAEKGNAPERPADNKLIRVQEIRFREINQQQVNAADLHLEDVCYHTAVSEEHFLQWVTANNRIAGFCRLSLPDWGRIDAGGCDVTADELAVAPGQAMIRELHVYGQALSLGHEGASAQHKGLGQRLLAKASDIASQKGYTRLNVISSIGTRAYYRHQGFVDDELYQYKLL